MKTISCFLSLLAVLVHLTYADASVEEQIQTLRKEVKELYIKKFDPAYAAKKAELQNEFWEKSKKLRSLEAAHPQIKIFPSSAVVSVPSAPLPSSPPPPTSKVGKVTETKSAAPQPPSPTSVSKEIAQLEVEIRSLSVQLANTKNPNDRLPLLEDHAVKSRRLEQLKSASKASSSTPAAPRSPPQTTSAPVASSPAPVPLKASTPISLTIYSAQELSLGKGTERDLNDIARALYSGDQANAQQQWVTYLQGESDALAGQKTKVDALIQYVARQAYIETDAKAPLAAALVDAAKKKGDANLISQTQADFNQFLAQRSDLQSKIANAVAFLRSWVK